MEKHPVFRSLTDQIMFLKVPMEYFIFIVILYMTIGIFLSIYFIGLLIPAILYPYGIVKTKQDPRWFKVIYEGFKQNRLNLTGIINRYVA